MELIQLLGLTTIGSFAGLIGGLVFLFKKEWAKVLASYAVPFAAGVLLAVSLLHLIPEAEHGAGDGIYLIVLVSFLASFLFDQYFAHLHHHEDRHGTMVRATVPLVLFGDTIHNFIDGVTIAAAFMTDPAFGVVITFATFLHETPHEIGDFGILLSNGWGRSKAFIANSISAFATFPGALITYYFLQDSHEQIGGLLAVSAGIFLYLGASDFLPEIGEENERPSWKKLMFVLIGVGIIYTLTLITPNH